MVLIFILVYAYDYAASIFEPKIPSLIYFQFYFPTFAVQQTHSLPVLTMVNDHIPTHSCSSTRMNFINCEKLGKSESRKQGNK